MMAAHLVKLAVKIEFSFPQPLLLTQSRYVFLEKRRNDFEHA